MVEYDNKRISEQASTAINGYLNSAGSEGFANRIAHRHPRLGRYNIK